MLRFLFSAVVGLYALSTSLAYGNINLEWRPAVLGVAVGETVEIGLYAVSDDETDQSTNLIEAILLWDETRLELLGHVDNGPYEWFGFSFQDDEGFDGLNAPFTGLPANDGNAWFVARSQLIGPPAQATPEGLLVGSFQFEALDAGETELELPAEFGDVTQTRVGGAEEAGSIVTGTLGPPAVVTIGPDVPTVSEWGLATMTLLLLSAGTIVLLRRGEKSVARAARECGFVAEISDDG